jgi:hypothetical protein
VKVLWKTSYIFAQVGITVTMSHFAACFVRTISESVLFVYIIEHCDFVVDVVALNQCCTTVCCKELFS